MDVQFGDSTLTMNSFQTEKGILDWLEVPELQIVAAPGHEVPSRFRGKQ